jgi:ApbE superfamily uncharacterized protein (UPF0280 family)
VRQGLSNADYSSEFLMPEQEPFQPVNQYIERTYRAITAKDLSGFRVAIGESDLYIQTNQPEIETQIETQLTCIRRQLKEYIHLYPVFAVTLEPFPVDPSAPEIVQAMITVAAQAGVGPMAAVAGAVAEFLANSLPEAPEELIIENGGDLYIRSRRERRIAVYAGDSPLSNKVALLLPPQPVGIGICTSAGTVGHSLSLGKADAVTVIAPSAALADAVATAIGNRVQTMDDLERALAFARSIAGVTGCIIIKESSCAVWGAIQLEPLYK